MVIIGLARQFVFVKVLISNEIPVASETSSIKCKKNEIVNLVPADTMEYRRLYDNKAVKKTLSIPKWLDTLAQRKKREFLQCFAKRINERDRMFIKSPSGLFVCSDE